MRVGPSATSMAMLLAACSEASRQLPARQGIGLDTPPTLQGTYLASNPEILGNNLASYVGAVCVPSTDICQGNSFAPGTYLAANRVAVVTPAAPNSSPNYRSLISSSFAVSGNFPFIKPAAGLQQLNEVEVRTVATATAPDGSFPGAAALRQRLRADGVNATRVYWVRSAGLVAVNTRAFNRVDSSVNVTGTGFGFDGKTFNGNEVSQQQVVVGLELRAVDFGALPAPAASPTAVELNLPLAPSQAIATGPAGEPLTDLSRVGRDRGLRPRSQPRNSGR